MKKTLMVILSFLLIVGSTLGQTKFVPHQKGDGAVLFRFDGLSDLGLGSYQGGVGYKRFINDNTAIRAAVDLYFYNEKISWGPENNPEGYVGEDGKDKETKIFFDVALEKHHNKGKVDPYYGGGLEFGITRTKFIEPVSGPQGTALTAGEVKNDLDGNAATRFEIYGLFGLEYAINSMLTLAAEYHLRWNLVSEPDMKVTDRSGVETSFSGDKYNYLSLGSVGFLTLAIYLPRK